MPLVDPVLDNRTFDALVAELRLRIPRFSKEFTNFNESDPGMTLVDVFAWLTEQTLFQLNQVPRKNYIKFLKLLGREAAAALPAKARATFAPAANNKTPVTVPSGFRITAQVNDGNPPLIFETDRGMEVIGTPLRAVGVYDGATLVPFTSANQQPGTRFHPFGLRPTPDSAFYLGFADPGGNPFPQELTFFVFLPPEATAGKAQQSDAPLPKPPVSLVWEYRNSADWTRLNVFSDESLAFTREGYIRVEQPAQIAAYRIDRLDPVPLLWIRARIDGPSYLAGQAPYIDILRPNTVDVVNLSTDRNRNLGASLGHPSEVFDLGRRPVEPASVAIQVNDSTDTWVRREDFLASKKDDPHFVVDASAGTIQFGDGTRGLIPPAGATITATQFRWGGGARGNLAASGLIKDMVGSLSGIDKVANERAATGGGEEESLNEIIAQGPQFLRRRGRAVTPEDFASFALEIDGVKNAVAIPCRHPDFPGVEVAGAVTVYIVPETSERPPKASSDLIRSVADALNTVRLLTTEVFVASPQFTQIRVEARLEAPPYVAFDAVAKAARQALDQLLDPQTWPFGKALHPTDVDRVLLNVKDVTAIQSRNIFVNGALQTASFLAIPTPRGGLIYGSGHLLIVTGVK